VYSSREALVLDNIDRECNFLRPLKRMKNSALKFVDLNLSLGATEFILSQTNDLKITGSRISPFDSKKIPPEQIILIEGISQDLHEQDISLCIKDIQKFAGKFKHGEGVDLFIGNITDDFNQNCTFNHRLLSESLIALSTLRKHGTFICRTHRAVRFSEVGQIHILSHYFKTISFLKPFISSPISEERYLILEDFQNQPSDNLLKFLGKVNRSFGELKENLDIVELVPPPVCINSQIRNMLVVANEEIYKKEIYALECLEKGTILYSKQEITEKIKDFFSGKVPEK